MKNNYKFILSLFFVFAVLLSVSYVHASPVDTTNITVPNIDIQVGTGEGSVGSTVQVVLVLTVLAMAPSILLMMTSFTRILIIFSFIRRALSLQATPPNQVLIGLSLFLTFFIMSPVFSSVYNEAYLPFDKGEIAQDEAFDRAVEPFKDFMLKNVRKDDLALFVKISEVENPEDIRDVSMLALMPAFIISELKTAFIVGFVLFIPFIIIDMVVASTLMALGMMMLPPVMISMPFKLLLFIMVDGWNLLTGAIVSGFSL